MMAVAASGSIEGLRDGARPGPTSAGAWPVPDISASTAPSVSVPSGSDCFSGEYARTKSATRLGVIDWPICTTSCSRSDCSSTQLW